MTDKITFDPAAPKSIDEGSYIAYTVRFYSSGTLTAPTTARYRVDDCYSDEEILAWTTATATTTATVSIAASLNVLEDEDNAKERRALTVEANEGTSTAYSSTAYYDILNNRGL